LTATVQVNASASPGGAADGKATVNPQGGTADYTFAWDNGSESRLPLRTLSRESNTAFDTTLVRVTTRGGLVGHGEARLPGAGADLGVGHVVLQRGHLLGFGVLRPQPLRAAEVRDPRVGRDAGAGQDGHARGGVDEGAGTVDGSFEIGVVCGHAASVADGSAAGDAAGEGGRTSRARIPVSSSRCRPACW